MWAWRLCSRACWADVPSSPSSSMAMASSFPAIVWHDTEHTSTATPVILRLSSLHPKAGLPSRITPTNEDRGHPDRFADLLPSGTEAEDFARIVLRPGWWEEYDQPRGLAPRVSGINHVEES